MVEAVRRYGRVFQTGSQLRSAEEFRRACELVQSGRIGTIQKVRVQVWGTSKPCHLPAEAVPPGLDWNQWIGPAPWRPYNRGLHPSRWRGFREFSGGDMTDLGAHSLDIVQWGLGTDHSGPVEVLPPEPAKNKNHVTFRYSSGVTVECGAVEVGDVQFIGADGTITVERRSLRAEPEDILKEPLTPRDVQLYRSPEHRADWIRCVEMRTRPICDVEIGHRSATLCHLANLAIWSRRAVRWDPEKEAIVGDAQLARWLDRPQRAPFHL
jgi:predicted dehydrogenase